MKILPLYRYRKGRKDLFANSLKALCEHIDPVLDGAGLVFYLENGYFPASHMVFRGVTKVVPAEMAARRLRGSLTEEICRRELRKRFENILAGEKTKHCGVLFTGGMDGVLLAVVLRSLGRGVSTICGGFQGFSDALFEEAAHTAGSLGFRHRNVAVSLSQAMSAWPCVVRAADEPVFDLDACVAYRLFGAIGPAGHLLYSGMGCDALFALEGRRLDWIDFLARSSAEVCLHENLVSAAGGRGIHFPYLDRRFADYVHSLPPRFRERAGIKKYILRRFAAEVLPPSLAAKRSASVSFPVDWIKAFAARSSKKAAACFSFARSCRKLLPAGKKACLCVLKIAYLAEWLEEAGLKAVEVS